MAKTLYFNDGTSEVLFDPDSQAAFARILREKLGEDAERHFYRIVHIDDANDIIKDLKCSNSAYETENADLLNQVQELEDDKRRLNREISQIEDELKDALAAAASIKSDASVARARVVAMLDGIDRPDLAPDVRETFECVRRVLDQAIATSLRR